MWRWRKTASPEADDQYIPRTLSRQSILMVQIISILIYFSLTPFFLTEYTRHMVDHLTLRATVIADLLAQDETDRDLERSAEIMRESGVLRLTIYDEHDQATRIFKFVSEKVDDQSSQITLRMVNSRDWLSYVIPTLALMLPTKHEAVYIKSLPLIGRDRISIVVDRTEFFSHLWQSFLLSLPVLFLLLIISHLVLRSVVTRSIENALKNSLAYIYRSEPNTKLSVDEQLREARERVDLRRDALEKHLGIQANNAAMGVLAGRMSHDMRNLLASLRLRTEAIKAEEGSPLQETQNLLLTAIDKASVLFQRDYAALERDDYELEITPLALEPLIEEIFLLIALRFKDLNIVFRNEVPEDLVFPADRVVIFRTLFNLTLNGAQALERKGGGTLTISAHNVNEEITIDIKDTGDGIDPDYVRDILDKKTSNVASRRGMGLPIAAALALMHGGRLELVEASNSGTHFRLCLINPV